MIMTRALALAVAVLHIAAGSAWCFMIEPRTVIWARGMTVEQGIRALEAEIVHAIQANPRAVNPEAEALREYFRQLESEGSFEGPNSNFELSGSDWNTYYNARRRLLIEERAEAARRASFVGGGKNL